MMEEIENLMCNEKYWNSQYKEKDENYYNDMPDYLEEERN